MTSTSPHSGNAATPLDRLKQVIEHAGHLLPAQGPITVFIHHNTLHAFEDLPFDAGVQAGAKVFGCLPYLPEDRYRHELARGRIRVDDLAEVLHEDLGERSDGLIGPLGTRYHLWLTMLQYPLRLGPTEELRWFVAETDALTRVRKDASPKMRERLLRETRHWVMRDLRNGQLRHQETLAAEAATSALLTDSRHERTFIAGLLERLGESSIEQWSEATWETLTLQALWRVCRTEVQAVESLARPAPDSSRHRDLLFVVTGEDSDTIVNDLLIRFSAAFLDQGMARWSLPIREAGFFKAFCSLYRASNGSPDWRRLGLPAELARLEDNGVSPLESIAESLHLLGVEETEWEEFIAATMLALRGWAGMIRQMELRADRVRVPAPAGSVTEFLAVRLILKRLVLAEIAKRRFGDEVPLNRLRDTLRSRLEKRDTLDVDQRAFIVFQIAQVRGWSPPALLRMSKQVWSLLVSEIEAFSELERRRVFHRAYERKFRMQTLDALTLHARRPAGRVRSPKCQAVFCIDEREESMRRHLEEIAPQTETFGAAGFFNVAIYYRGAGDAHFVPLCPIVIRPQHWLVEDVAFTQGGDAQRRAKTRKAIGTASHRVHVGSRSAASGAILTASLGVLASIPLVARVLFPRLTALVLGTASRLVRPPEATQLRLERAAPTPGPDDEQIGLNVLEMTNNAERLLRDIGLTTGFARLVMIIGHGSNSLNNPHRSAYECGACGGNAGAPNARAAAQILNDQRVRTELLQRGLAIPCDTVFVGGYHNTCNDSVTFSDLDRLPYSHQAEFAEFQQNIETTCDRNAHERCRRFMSAPLNLSFPAARRHVEERAEDLAQARPECGHATNAICIVGRRERTRGLYLDRRAFLVSYDPHADDADGTILTRLMSAVVPVCGGISLEYYFSYVDSVGWGCGTKLPHNITSLLGVMDGAASDLRTGLPWQMVEIHEPVRLLIVIETTPEKITAIMDRNPGIGKPCRNDWVQLVTWNPDSTEMHILRGDHFEPYRPAATELPRAATSTDWYRGWRDHLDFAEIEGPRETT